MMYDCKMYDMWRSMYDVVNQEKEEEEGEDC